MKVLLIGEVSSGKSSFLNSLFGLPLSNISLQRETFDIYKYINGSENQVNDTIKNYDYIHNINKNHRDKNTEIHDKVNIKYFPHYHDLLKDIEIIDFPGINDSALDNDKLYNIIKKYTEDYCIIFYLVEEKRVNIENDLYGKLKGLINDNLKNGNYNKLIRIITKSNILINNGSENDKYYYNNYVGFIQNVIKYKIVEKTPATFINEYKKILRNTCYISKDMNYDMIDYNNLELKKEYENYNVIIMDICEAFHNKMEELQYKTLIESNLSLSNKLDRMNNQRLLKFIIDYIDNNKINESNIKIIFSVKNIKKIDVCEKIYLYYIKLYLSRDKMINSFDGREKIVLQMLINSSNCIYSKNNCITSKILKKVLRGLFHSNNRKAKYGLHECDTVKNYFITQYFTIRKNFTENIYVIEDNKELFIELINYVSNENLLTIIFKNLTLTIEDLKQDKNQNLVNKIIYKNIEPIFKDENINKYINFVNSIVNIKDLTKLSDDTDLYKYILSNIENLIINGHKIDSDNYVNYIKIYILEYLINNH